THTLSLHDALPISDSPESAARHKASAHPSASQSQTESASFRPNHSSPPPPRSRYKKKPPATAHSRSPLLRERASRSWQSPPDHATPAHHPTRCWPAPAKLMFDPNAHYEA